MKLGDVVAAGTLSAAGFSYRDLELGRVSLKHPRCGLVVLALEAEPNVVGNAVWRVVKIERPDK